MRHMRAYEFAAGWLAVVIGVAVAVYTYLGGYIAPFAVRQDLIGCAVILAVIALGVTLECFTGSLAARIILTLGTLAWGVAVEASFIAFLLPSVGLALLATILAFMRHALTPTTHRVGA